MPDRTHEQSFSSLKLSGLSVESKNPETDQTELWSSLIIKIRPPNQLYNKEKFILLLSDLNASSCELLFP